MRPLRPLRTSTQIQPNGFHRTAPTSFLSRWGLRLTRTPTSLMVQIEVQFRQLRPQESWFSNQLRLVPLRLPEKVRKRTQASRFNIFINHPRALSEDPHRTPGLKEMVVELSTNTSHRKSKLKARVDSCRWRSPRSCLKDHHHIQIEMNWRRSNNLMASRVLSTSGPKLSISHIKVRQMAQTLAAQKLALILLQAIWHQTRGVSLLNKNYHNNIFFRKLNKAINILEAKLKCAWVIAQVPILVKATFVARPMFLIHKDQL